MIIYPLIRAARIATACAIVVPEYSLPIAALTETLSSVIPIMNTNIPLSSYLTPFLCDPKQTIYLLYSHNREKYEQIELISLILLLILYYKI
tara:strand:- start:599 stop:874 length:276 start_codon:yes stop_codon:yes gene_type:complete